MKTLLMVSWILVTAAGCQVQADGRGATSPASSSPSASGEPATTSATTASESGASQSRPAPMPASAAGTTGGASGGDDAEKRACESRGGRWGLRGIAQKGACDMPTPDARKPCTDKKQCTSACISRANIEAGQPATGECYEWSLLVGTCLTHVEQGKSVGTLCAD